MVSSEPGQHKRRAQPASRESRLALHLAFAEFTDAVLEVMRCARSSTTSRRRWTWTATTGAAASGPRSPWSRTATTSAPTAAWPSAHLPLTHVHPHALAAAHLAEAAALQGHFWPMHELLFHHQQALEASIVRWTTTSDMP